MHFEEFLSRKGYATYKPNMEEDNIYGVFHHQLKKLPQFCNLTVKELEDISVSKQ